MPLQPGDALGPYEILAPIGAGGMGEVYKARDTRLERTVAVKVLPEHIAKREDARTRFEREARAVASLNHPNICTLHDIGDGYMVMELIEGETVAERIAKGALPLEQALKYAVQIADALDRAHRAGVTHRDVKPQNIMLTRDGVKVLDFGLAKSVTAKPGPTEETLTKVLTAEGTVVGTPQYMAPEQFEGREADARSDIWAFGAVLYEMVTGRKAFEGKSYTSLVGAILSADPAPMAIEPFTPSWLERLVRRCLAKDPDDRWQSMRDIVLELRTPPPAEIVAGKARRWPLVAAVAAAVVVGTLIGWFIKGPGPSTLPDPVQRFQLLPPEGGQFNMNAGFALSPDGRTLAFIATANGQSGLWLRPLEGTAARLLPGTQNAAAPFWSPDGRSLAFRAANKLWRVEAAGGAPIALCDLRATSGGDWSTDGAIVLSGGNVGLVRVPSSGGTPQTLTEVDAARGETSHGFPQALPGGRVLFRVWGKPEVEGVYAFSLANPRERIRVLATSGGIRYAAGHLLWSRGTALMAQRFDAERLQLSGEPRLIADEVTWNAFAGLLAAGSSNGLLVVGSGAGKQLTWFDRAGKVPPSSRAAFGPGFLGSFQLSPDGRRLAVTRASGSGSDVWMVDIERDAWTRLTFLPGYSSWPVWSPDSRQVIFRGRLGIYRKDASGEGSEQRVTESANMQTPTAWSGDRRLLLYHELAPDTQRDLWVLPVTPDGKPAGAARPYLRTRFNEYFGRFSAELRPEGGPRWVAYMSDESGRDEVYVQAFPEPRGKFQISTGGGAFPEWSPDGRELYYVSAEGKVMAAGLRVGGDSVTPSLARELFALPHGSPLWPSYALAPDGKRFLVEASAGGSQPLEVIVNWPALLKQGASKE